MHVTVTVLPRPTPGHSHSYTPLLLAYTSNKCLLFGSLLIFLIFYLIFLYYILCFSCLVHPLTAPSASCLRRPSSVECTYLYIQIHVLSLISTKLQHTRSFVIDLNLNHLQ